MKYRSWKRHKPYSLRRKILLGLSLLAAATGLYLLLLVTSPGLPGFDLSKYEPIDIATVPIGDRQLIIPKIGVNIQFLEGNASTLEKAAWHRFPERGNPEVGGNFIVSAHRFRLGLTPEGTRARSPFYNINKLEAGDKIYADYNGKRHEYVITKKYAVKPHQTEIEAPSDSPKLTLYSCTLKGSHDGREVIEAVPSNTLEQT